MVEQLLSTRLHGVGEYYFSQKLREIEGLIKQGHPILNLGIGSPDLNPPEQVERELKAEMESPKYHQYQSYKGLPELRSAFSEWYGRYFRTKLDPDEEILPLMGSKEGIMHVCMALLNDGDKVLVPNPGYPTYKSASKLAGAEVIEYPLNETTNYLPDFNALESLDLKSVKLMWVNYPHMPTGTDSSNDLFDQLLHFSRKHQIVVVNDNPYAFILTKERRSLLRNRLSSDLVLELTSLSKSHNMSGWRVGALSGNPQLVQAVLRFKSNMDSGQFKPVMKAAIVALKIEGEWYEKLNEVYHERRRRVFEIADLLKCTYDPHQVGMFVWAHIPKGHESGKSYADKLLDQYGIFIPPGSVFGSEGERYIRFSLCSDLTVWNEVFDRIKSKNGDTTN